MSQPSYSRGRFQSRGRSGGRDGGWSSQRIPGRYEAAQAARVPVKSSEDDENFVFDIQPNRVDNVKFVAAQRKIVDYISTRYADVGKIISHGYEIKHTYPERPEPLEAGKAGGYD